MKILGIAAPKGTGKTTLANLIQTNLEDNYQKRVKILPFATPLKRMCWLMFGGSEKHWYGTDAEKSVEMGYWKDRLGEPYSTPRRIMQTMGTDIVRNNVDPQFWTMAFNKILLDWSAVDVVIVDDVRFDNESVYLRSIGATIIHLHRNNNEWSNEHESEKGPTPTTDDLDVNFDDIASMKEYSKTLVKLILSHKDCKPL